MFKKKEYWDHRYKKGYDSGEGSVGVHRDWKWSQIESIIPSISEVVDVGCGDLRFWEGKDCPSYIGLDISPTIIKQNITKRPQWGFICGNAITRYPFKANVVLCMDMLFHIMNDDDFDKILDNLMEYTKEWIIIYTWDKNPFSTKDDMKYQAFRKLPIERFKEFKLVHQEAEPTDKYGKIFIFRYSGKGNL